MYETIMDLPLFKGVGKNHISQFLEKTHIDFRNFSGGELVAAPGEPVDKVMFLISGELFLVSKIGESGITIGETVVPGSVVGAERLFGLDKTFPCSVIAGSRASIMEFSKGQYIKLLQSDPIYELNFLNFLSFRAQRGKTVAGEFWRGDVHSRICQLILLAVDPSSERVVVRGTDSSLSRYCHAREEDIFEWKSMLADAGVAECNPVETRIADLRRFLDFKPEKRDLFGEID